MQALQLRRSYNQREAWNEVQRRLQRRKGTHQAGKLPNQNHLSSDPPFVWLLFFTTKIHSLDHVSLVCIWSMIRHHNILVHKPAFSNVVVFFQESLVPSWTGGVFTRTRWAAGENLKKLVDYSSRVRRRRFGVFRFSLRLWRICQAQSERFLWGEAVLQSPSHCEEKKPVRSSFKWMLFQMQRCLQFHHQAVFQEWLDQTSSLNYIHKTLRNARSPLPMVQCQCA